MRLLTEASISNGSELETGGFAPYDRTGEGKAEEHVPVFVVAVAARVIVGKRLLPHFACAVFHGYGKVTISTTHNLVVHVNGTHIVEIIGKGFADTGFDAQGPIFIVLGFVTESNRN